MNNDVEVHVLEWRDIGRQGVKKDGMQNTQLELSRTIVPMKDLMNKILTQMIKCRSHIGEHW